MKCRNILVMLILILACLLIVKQGFTSGTYMHFQVGCGQIEDGECPGQPGKSEENDYGWFTNHTETFHV